MCGIAGFCSFHQDTFAPEEARTRLLRCVEALRHRGPDGSGIYLNGGTGLAHTRLAIIDPKGAPQPMHRRHGERGGSLVYNGELYNTAELRGYLARRGHIFETSSDTEVLLAGLMEEGADFLEKLNGIFAFAFWDGLSLLLARDRLGVKPLYYATEAERLYFGSEPKALFALGFGARLEDNGLRELFALGPAHTPGNGIFAGLREVLPAEYLRMTPGGLHKRQYWQLESRPHTENEADTIENVAFLVQDAVERQMVSDVPICTFLSGGLDSSLISSIAAKKLAAQGRRLTTFSFDFAGNEDYYKANAFQPSRDAPFAAEMAEYLQTEHYALECDNAALADLLETAMVARDFPGMADVDASLLYFCRIVGQDYKVALTGETADECAPTRYNPNPAGASGDTKSNQRARNGSVFRPASLCIPLFQRPLSKGHFFPPGSEGRCSRKANAPPWGRC
jgi:asparagine synthase (glutamine-hydrolysing)